MNHDVFCEFVDHPTRLSRTASPPVVHDAGQGYPFGEELESTSSSGMHRHVVLGGILNDNLPGLSQATMSRPAT